MNKSRLGGIARARSLSPSRRSKIAHLAARARWSRRPGILKIEDIRRQVAAALSDRDAQVFLFGSYARREATPSSDVDLLVVERSPVNNIMQETAILRRRLNFERPVDLIVMDQPTYDEWKDDLGTVQNEVSREGVRLV